MKAARFINSKDVRDYLTEIDYEFSPVEAAWLVERCKSLSLDEKIGEWNTIIDTTHDCRVESPYGDFGKTIESFHEAVKDYIDGRSSLIVKLRESGDNVYYERRRSERDYFPLIGHYKSYDDCCISINELKEKDMMKGRYEIHRIDVGSGERIIGYFSDSGKLIDVETNKGNESYKKYIHLFWDMWPDFPIPFKKGDILRYVSDRVQPDEKLTVMNELRTRSRDDITIFGKEDKIKHLFGYFQTDIGTLCEKPAWGHYVDFEYCPEELLEGKEKILISLSNYLKGKIPLEVFVNDYHLIMLKDQIEEIRSEQMFSSASLDN